MRLRLILLTGLPLAGLAFASVAEPPRLQAVPTGGCSITFRGTNSAGYTITFQHESSRVKVRRGLWKKLGNWYGTARPSGTLTSSVTLDLGCSLARQYRLYFEGRSGEDATCEYPGNGGWTDRQSIQLGDIARYFDSARSSVSCAQ